MKCPMCNQQGELEFGELNTGFAAGTTTDVTAKLDTAEDDWTYPVGVVYYDVFSCKSGCSDKHGAIWSKASGSFEILPDN